MTEKYKVWIKVLDTTTVNGVVICFHGIRTNNPHSKGVKWNLTCEYEDRRKGEKSFFFEKTFTDEMEARNKYKDLVDTYG